MDTKEIMSKTVEEVNILKTGVILKALKENGIDTSNLIETFKKITAKINNTDGRIKETYFYQDKAVIEVTQEVKLNKSFEANISFTYKILK